MRPSLLASTLACVVLGCAPPWEKQQAHVPPPKIIGVEPAFGDAAGGSEITILGENLSDAEVTLGGRAVLELVEESPGRLTGTLAATPAGMAQLVVKTPGGVTKATDAFEFRLWMGGQEGMKEPRLAVVATPPGAKDYVYVLTPGGSLFRSVDHGASFRWMSSALWPSDRPLLAFAPGNPDIVFGSCSERALCRSDDGGLRWSVVIQDWGVNQIVTDFARGKMYVAAHGWMGRSSDGGETWQKVTHDYSLNLTSIEPDPVVDGRLYATVDGYGVIRSDDDGVTWSAAWNAVSACLPYEPVTRLLASTTSGRLIAACSQSGLRISSDGAASFTPVAGITGGFWDLERIAETAGGFLAGGASILRSTDDGQTWETLGGEAPASAFDLHSSAPGELYLGTSADGLYRHENGAWRSLNEAIPPAETLFLSRAADGTLYVTTWTSRVYSSSDGLSWTPLGIPEPHYVGVVQALKSTKGTRLYFQSLWASVLEPGETEWSRSWQVTEVTADPVVAERAIAFVNGEPALTEDGGDTWTPRPLPQPSQIEAFAPRDSGSGTEFFALSQSQLLHLSAAGTWSVVGPGIPDVVSKFVATRGGSFLVVAGNPQQLWRLAPGATTWAKVVPEQYFYPEGLGAAYSGGDIVVVGGSYRVGLHSSDGGATWRALDLLPNTWAWDFAFDPRDARVLHASMGPFGVLTSRTGGLQVP